MLTKLFTVWNVENILSQLACIGLCFEWTSNKRVAKILMTLLPCYWDIRKINILCFHCQYFNGILMTNDTIMISVCYVADQTRLSQ